MMHMYIHRWNLRTHCYLFAAESMG